MRPQLRRRPNAVLLWEDPAAPGEREGAAEAPVTCGQRAENIDYLTTVFLYKLYPIKSEKMCTVMCSREPKCDVWTWGKVPGVLGLSNVCFLKALGQGDLPKLYEKQGVVAGIRCRNGGDDAAEPTTTEPAETTAAEGSFSAGASWGDGSSESTADSSADAEPGSAGAAWGSAGTETDTSDGGLATSAERPGAGQSMADGGSSGSLAMADDASTEIEADATAESEYASPDSRAAEVGELAADGDGCSAIEENIDYWTKTSLYYVSNVNSSRRCRSTCGMDAKCAVWTWGKARGIVGLTDVCFLKQVGPGEEPERHRKYGVVSGKPCHGGTGEELPGGAAVAPVVEVTTLPPTTTTVGPTTTTLPQHYPPGSLFCFVLILPTGYEPMLLAMQHAEHAGVFGCDEHAVYSNQVIQIAPGLHSAVIDSDMKCEYGGEFGTALNTDIFLVVWEKVISDGRYRLHDWSIKVDADTVFFADRLRGKLEHHKEGPHGVYLNNCKFGMHGPLEIYSRTAVDQWAKGSAHCLKHFNHLCSGPCLWGEDMFIDQCLQRVLHVKRDNDYTLLAEDHCDPPKHWKDCKNGTMAAFHPFKDLDGWRTCFDNANSHARSA